MTVLQKNFRRSTESLTLAAVMGAAVRRYARGSGSDLTKSLLRSGRRTELMGMQFIHDIMPHR